MESDRTVLHETTKGRSFIMIIYSEKTKEKYTSIEECQKAEAEFDALTAKKEAEQKKLAEQRRERAREVEDAYKRAVEADKEFSRLRNKFIHDYGSFHMTYRSENDTTTLEDNFQDMLSFLIASLTP